MLNVAREVVIHAVVEQRAWLQSDNAAPLIVHCPLAEYRGSRYAARSNSIPSRHAGLDKLAGSALSFHGSGERSLNI